MKSGAFHADGSGFIYRGSLKYARSSTGALTLVGADIPSGMLTPDGPCYTVKDHLGSVVYEVNASTGTFADGALYDEWGGREALAGVAPSTVSCRHFTGKEDQWPDFTVPYTDFGARHYSPALRRWLTPDPLSEKYYTSSPYAYCAGDPVNSVDPDGRIVRGATRDDIHRIIDDINEIFRDGVFDNFRPLIMPSGRNNNGRSLAKISAQSLYEAFQDVELSDDQKALVEIVVNTINSDSIHIVEYITGALISKSAENAFSGDLPDLVQGTIDVNGGLSAEILQAFYGEGATTRTYNGTYSIIQPNGYSVCRPVTLGHELFGHGRSLALGRTDPYRQHVDAIQLENLIYRVMGINHINRGNNHAQRQFIPNPSQIPSYR